MHKWADLKKRKFSPEQLASLEREVEHEAHALRTQAALEVQQVRERLRGRGLDDGRWTDEEIEERLAAEDATTGAVAEDLAALP